jgi:hypothetical protein
MRRHRDISGLLVDIGWNIIRYYDIYAYYIYDIIISSIVSTISSISLTLYDDNCKIIELVNNSISRYFDNDTYYDFKNNKIIISQYYPGYGLLYINAYISRR